MVDVDSRKLAYGMEARTEVVTEDWARESAVERADDVVAAADAFAAVSAGATAVPTLGREPPPESAEERGEEGREAGCVAGDVATATPSPSSVKVEAGWAPVAGEAVELQYCEAGMSGSWYSAQLLQLLPEGAAFVEVCGLLSEGEGPLRESHPIERLRPPPPRIPEDFASPLKAGQMVDVWYAEGWWQAEVVGPRGEGELWEVECGEYSISHTVPASSLRPAWRWDAAEGWSVVEKERLAGSERGGERRKRRIDVTRESKHFTREVVGLPSEARKEGEEWEREEARRKDGEDRRRREAEERREEKKREAEERRRREGEERRREGEKRRREGEERRREGEEKRRRETEEKKTKREGEEGNPKREGGKMKEVKEASTNDGGPLYSVGVELEVEGTEEGFFGSWYTARVLEVRGGRQLHLCFLAFQDDDGSLLEDTVDEKFVRPLPPPHASDFLARCAVGTLLEVLLRGGWWEVALLGVEGARFVVGAERYGVTHRVHASHLRPAWSWDRQRRLWSSPTLAKPLKLAKAAKREKEAKAVRSPPVVGAIGCTKNSACLRGARHPGLCRFASPAEAKGSGVAKRGRTDDPMPQ
ncbi:MAG: hypothetical protein SGPRY_012124 [Prymnesium sp.]